MEHETNPIEREVAGIVCAMLVVLLVLVPRNASALAAVVVALVVPAAVFLARPLATVRVSKATRLVQGASAIPAVVAFATALAAESVPVSLWGARGQHTGAWLWVALAGTFFALTERARKGDLLRIARSVACAGGFLGFAGLLTVPFLVSRAPWLQSFGLSDSPSGIMENSISLAQTMLVALGAASVWALESRDVRGKRAGFVALALCAMGLLVTNTRTAMLAIAAVAVVFLLLRLYRQHRRKPRLDARVLATLVVAAAVVVLGLTWVMGSLEPTAKATVRWDEVLNGRVTVWAAAVAAVPERLLVGGGPDQFTAWVGWDSVPGRSLEQISTDDPHSFLLYWLLAGGILGGVVALGALWVLSWRVFAALESTQWRWSMVALSGCVATWLLSTAASWTSPLAALFAAMLLAALSGALDASAARDSGEAEQESAIDAPGGEGRDVAVRGKAFVPAAVALALAAVIAVTGLPVMRAEFAWARALRARQQLSAEQHLDLARLSGDPAYAVDAAVAFHQRLIQTRDPGLAATTLAQVEPLLSEHASWSVYAALESITLNADAAIMQAGADWTDVAEAVQAGKRVGPTSGLWDYAGAVQATSLERAADAREHARAALGFWLPDAVRAWCEEVVVP